MQSALVFDIKRFATHDGPGIRTTFFLMGCPLRCLWCQNPEAFVSEQRIAFNPMKCISCGACALVCGKLDDTLRLPRAACDLCGKCVQVCPTGAKKFTGTEMTSAEVVNIALEDRLFYDTSGGGISFSGGECLTHAAFMEETLKLCRKNRLHTVVDTCGAVPWQTFQRVLPLTDLFLYDLKVMDPEKHREYTGSSNKLILENLEKLVKHNASIIIRVPLIPGYTDTDENIEAIGHFISYNLANRIERIELLPYNRLAMSKYGQTTIWTDGGPGPYPLPDLQTQEDSKISALAEILRRRQITVFTESL